MGINYAASYLREQIKAASDTLYIFGDNFERKGFGGQAAEARGEPNAVGIPTKRAPSMRPDAFLTDVDLARLQAEARPALDRLRRHLDAGGDVVMPSAESGPASPRWRRGRRPAGPGCAPSSDLSALRIRLAIHDFAGTGAGPVVRNTSRAKQQRGTDQLHSALASAPTSTRGFIAPPPIAQRGRRSTRWIAQTARRSKTG